MRLLPLAFGLAALRLGLAFLGAKPLGEPRDLFQRPHGPLRDVYGQAPLPASQWMTSSR